jgi:hypothetical protein
LPADRNDLQIGGGFTVPVSWNGAKADPHSVYKPINIYVLKNPPITWMNPLVVLETWQKCIMLLIDNICKD